MQAGTSTNRRRSRSPRARPAMSGDLHADAPQSNDAGQRQRPSVAPLNSPSSRAPSVTVPHPLHRGLPPSRAGPLLPVAASAELIDEPEMGRPPPELIASPGRLGALVEKQHLSEVFTE